MQKNKKHRLVALFLVLLLGTGVAFAALSANFTVNGTLGIKPDGWKVAISEVEGTNTTSATALTDTTASWAAGLDTAGESASVTITVENQGTIDATLSAITTTPTYTSEADAGVSAAAIDDYVTITTTPVIGTDLAAGDTTDIVVTATLSSDADAIANLNLANEVTASLATSFTFVPDSE